MNWLISKGDAEKQISIKNYILIAVLGIVILTGIGISGIWANEENTGNNLEDAHFSYQNAAQAHHAKNLAVQATFQDPVVAEAIARAKTSKDPQDIQDAQELFQDKFEEVSKQVSEMRASGMGWGKIAQHVNVHPSYLGRGRSKVFNKHDFSYSKYSRTKSEIKSTTAKSYKGKDATRLNSRNTLPKGKSPGQSRAKDSDHSMGRGHAFGHSKGKGGNAIAGHGAGHGGGHGHGGSQGGGNGK